MAQWPPFKYALAPFLSLASYFLHRSSHFQVFISPYSLQIRTPQAFFERIIVSQIKLSSINKLCHRAAYCAQP